MPNFKQKEKSRTHAVLNRSIKRNIVRAKVGNRNMKEGWRKIQVNRLYKIFLAQGNSKRKSFDLAVKHLKGLHVACDPRGRRGLTHLW